MDINIAERMLRVYEGIYFKQENVETEHLRKLQYDWFICTDKEVEESLEIVLKALQDNKYDITFYSQIIGMLLIIEDVGFDASYIQKAVTYMKANIQSLEYYTMIDTGYRLDTDTDIGKRHQKIISELQNEINVQFKSRTAIKLEKCISSGDGWAGKLYEHIKNTEVEIRNETGFLSQINIDSLVDTIAHSSSQDINSFRNCIILIYKEGTINAVLRTEESLLIKLYEDVQKIDKESFDRIRTAQMRYL